MGRRGELTFAIVVINDDGSEDQNLHIMDDDECSMALEDVVNSGNPTDPSNSAKHSSGCRDFAFEFDSSCGDEWDSLLLSEAYHYQFNNKDDLPFEVATKEIREATTHDRVDDSPSLNVAPPFRELLQQSSSRRLLMETTRQYSSRRLLLASTRQVSSLRLVPSVDRSSSRRLLAAPLQSGSSQSLLRNMPQRDDMAEPNLLMDELNPNLAQVHSSTPTASRRMHMHRQQSSSRRIVLLNKQPSSRRLLFSCAKQSSSGRLLLKRQISSHLMKKTA
eukprot:scaffold4442_cov125-Amphora_coffeaeformis.AAC.14